MNLGSQQFLGFLVVNRLRERSYVVRPGDTVELVSVQTGVPVADIIRVNHLRPPYRLHPGQLLRFNVDVR